MKFVALVVVALAAMAAAETEKALRLPLPEDVARRMPWLLHEQLELPPWVKIVGGSNAAAGEAPYQIALLRSGSFTCGGSLIGNQKVLTAAHCVAGSETNPSVFTVRYGTLDRTTGPTLSVSKVNRHAQYSSSTIDYDAATLILSAPFTPGTNAAIVPLATANPGASANLLLTGWGRLSGGGTLPTALQKAANLKALTQSECQSIWGSINTITPRMLCAFATTQSACNGDSGGPLVTGGQQVGVVSWGISGCATGTYPSVFVSVSNLLSWINSAN